MSDNKTIISPRLRDLQQELASGNSEALEDFWEEVAKQGTPLIEESKDDEGYSLVTFLWRSKDIGDVSIISLLTDPTTHPMTRLPEADLWYMFCKVGNDIRATYQFFVEDASQTSDDPNSRITQYRRDPLNPRHFDFFTEDEDPMGVKFSRSVLEMPEVAPQPWIEPQDTVPKGNVELHQVHSEVLGNQRDVWVYTPPGYSPDDATYDLFILFDGWAYAKLVPTFTILDNLISAGHIPPVVAVLQDSLDAETRMQEYIFHQPFNDFLVTEFMPWIHRNFSATSDSSRTVIGGSSAGGLAAAYAAIEHPEVFGNVLAQSGAFAFSPQGEDEPEGLRRQLAERDTLPIKFHLDAGILEENSLRPGGSNPSLLTATRNLRDVLQTKGYEVNYAELGGGHDYISWQGSLPDGLQALLGSQ